MFAITKVDRRQFPARRPFDYSMVILMRIMLAGLLVSFIYYIIDCLVRGGK